MAKTITFNYKDKDYTLEYTRKTIEAMEKQGFNVDEVEKRPLQTLHQMFKGAFKCHHSTVSDATIDEIYDKIDNTGGLMKSLVDMYKEAVETLTEEDKSVGEIKWEMK